MRPYKHWKAKATGLQYEVKKLKKQIKIQDTIFRFSWKERFKSLFSWD